MKLADPQVEGLNAACDEAKWVGLQINKEERWAGITLSVLSLPEEGQPPEDPRVQLILQPLHRIAASCRNGFSKDKNARAIPLTAKQLEEIVFGRQTAISGCEFFNIPSEGNGFSSWSHRLSLDIELSKKESANTINLFQDTNPFLQIRIWFSDLLIFDSLQQQIPLEQFIAGGERWWKGLYAGDPRTKGLNR
jgi:hypothetical protein